MSRFKDEAEFKEVIGEVFQLMNDHPEVGPRLNRARAPHRFAFPDLGLCVHVTYTGPGEVEAGRFLRWTWNENECDWEPMIRLSMSSDVANRYFQGKENVALAVATGRIKIKGPLPKLLELAPVLRPIHSAYRDWLEVEGRDHLLV